MPAYTSIVKTFILNFNALLMKYAIGLATTKYIQSPRTLHVYVRYKSWCFLELSPQKILPAWTVISKRAYKMLFETLDWSYYT